MLIQAGPKEPPQQTVQPVEQTEAQPDQSEPQATQQQDTEKPYTPPVDVTLPTDQTVIRYLAQRDYFFPFPGNRFFPNQPISRAEFITLLYRAADYNTPFLSEYAYYRDVPTDFWAYQPIEGFRMRNLLAMFQIPEGMFTPDKPIKRRNAALLFSKTLPSDWLPLSQDDVDRTLAYYNVILQNCDPTCRTDMARMIYGGYLEPRQQNGKLVIALDEPLNRMEAVHMVYRRATFNKEAQEMAKKTILPEGIEMTVTPTSVIHQERLVAGSPIYFSLVDAVEVSDTGITMPRGTRLHGIVTAVSIDRLTAQVNIDEAVLPSEEQLGLYAELQLNFEQPPELPAANNQKKRGKEKKPKPDSDGLFIVPGQNYVITTEAPTH